MPSSSLPLEERRRLLDALYRDWLLAPTEPAENVKTADEDKSSAVRTGGDDAASAPAA
jgi:hypothetical protein